MSVSILAEATFESQLGGKVKLTQYDDGTCAIRVTDEVDSTLSVMLTNPLARCVASTLSEMAGD
jgi:hypothetical protein